MTCPNQLELGGKKLREISEADAPVREGPNSVGVWTLKTSFAKVSQFGPLN